jgi:tetratricopeptide (TPR) repeat protein
MSIIDRILGRIPSTGQQITATPASRNVAPESLPGVSLSLNIPARPAAEAPIRVYDPFGRPMQIGRDAWRKEVLLPSLQARRDDPDALYDLIGSALQDGLGTDVLEPARHLASIDPRPERGAMLLGAVLLQLGRAAEAREVLQEAVRRHGRHPYLLSNLSRALAALGDDAGALELVRESLELAPNEEPALRWYVSLLTPQGEQVVRAAHARLAAMPGSWRAQLWMAQDALQEGDLIEATRLYEEALSRARPVPADLLTKLSGDLGNHRQPELLLRLTLPHFDVREHGLVVGNNLMRAYVETGKPGDARKLLDSLYAVQRPDWRDQLLQWEQQLDLAEKRYGEVTEPLEMVVVKLDQPVWTRGVLGFEQVLPVKGRTAPRVQFVCGSAEAEDHVAGKVVTQPTNELGRLSRSLPMFLAEELHLRTNARCSFLLPWMKQGGFVLSARPWTQEFLPPDHVSPDLMVFLHVDARATPWLLRLRIENLQRQATPVEFERAFTMATAGEDVLALLRDLTSRLTILLALRREETDLALHTPSEPLLPGYLACLEQALALGLAARHAGDAPFLHQERSIIDHLFDVALQGQDLVRPRMLLVNALEHQSRRRPDIVAEYLSKLTLLQEQYALAAGPWRDLVDRAVATVTAKAQEPQKTGA